MKWSWSLGLCLLLLGTGGTSFAQGKRTPIKVSESLESIFEDKGYGFCHEADYPLSPAERAYCPLVGEKSRACPELPQACKNENYPELVSQARGEGQGRRYQDFGDSSGSSGDGERRWGDGAGKNGKSNGGSGDGKQGAEGDSKSGKPPPPPPEPIKIEVPGWLAMLAKALFYLLAAAVVGFIIYLIVKNLLKGREKEESEDEEPGSEAPAEEAAPVARGPVETDVDRLLARARAAAARGDYRAAIDDSYAAVLRRLEGDGHIDLHPSKTNGDYQRQLRERTDIKQALREIIVDVERVHFGSEQASEPLFSTIYRRVLPLVGRTASVLILLLSVATQLSCSSVPSLGKSAGGAPGPLGWRAVADLLNRHDHDVVAKRDAEIDLENTKRTIVLLPDAPVDEKVVRDLLRWAKNDGGQLVVAGHREEIGEELRLVFSETQRTSSLRPGEAVPYRLMGFELGLPSYGRLVDTSATGATTTLLARGEIFEDEIYAGMKEYPSGGRVVLFADDALFKNLALLVGDNAAFLVALFEHLDQEDVEFWDGYTVAGSASGGEGKGSSSPLDAMNESKLTPVILHLLALVILYLFYRGVRFGTPRDPREQGRRAFADHARALGTSYARAKASRHALGVYAVWAMERLRERFSRSGKKGLIPLAESIAERTGRPVGQVMEILTEATGARDEVAPPSSYRPGMPQAVGYPQQGPARDIAVMRELESFLAATHGNKPPK